MSQPSSPSASKYKYIQCPTPDIVSAIRALVKLDIGGNGIVHGDGDALQRITELCGTAGIELKASACQGGRRGHQDND